MKIRVGFVSNSSSSSFVVFGKEVGIDEIDDLHVKFYGYNGSEGSHFFRPTDEMIEYMKAHWDSDMEGKLVYEYFSYCEDGDDVDVTELQKNVSSIKESKVSVMCFDIDHWDPESLDDFIESYGTDEDRDREKD